MLELVEKPSINDDLQQHLREMIESHLPAIGEKRIGFPGGVMMVETYTRGAGLLYFSPCDQRTSHGKFWNAFGFYQPERSSQDISVEINIYQTGLGGASFFAIERHSGRAFLMHNGRIGGGRKGVGRAAFFAWDQPELTPVIGSDGKIYPAIVVAELDQRTLALGIGRFVERVRDFKRFIRDGQHGTSSFQDRLNAAVERYSREWSGRRKGNVDHSFDYISYHGDVVDAIRQDLQRRHGDSVLITNTTLVDLMARFRRGRPRLYEVKTNLDRQSLYTAIGQLFVHGSSEADAEMHIVVPEGDLSSDIQNALHVHSIFVHRFVIDAATSKVSVYQERRPAVVG